MGPIGDLSLPAVDILWQDLKLGGLPFPLEIPSHGDTVEERARIRAAVYTQLERRGLARSGRAGAALAGVLRLLAAPKIGIDLVALPQLDAPRPIRAVVSARGKNAVLAVQRELAVSLAVLRDTAIVSSIVELLPRNKSGPGQSITLPAAMLSNAAESRSGRHRRDENDSGVLRTATRLAEHTAELRFLDSVRERPVIRAGSIGVILRDDRGKIQRLPGIAFFDTDLGRYTTTVLRGPDGENWTTLSPADNGRLSHRLAETLVAALRQ
jgi:hypothetical protein